MKLFKTIDEKFKELGFDKTYESDIVVDYEKYIDKYKYTHVIELINKSNGQKTIHSYEKEINKDGFTNSVGMTKEETKLAIKKLNKMK